MFALKTAFLSVLVVVLLMNNINCSEDKVIEEEQNENKTKSENKSDENYDEIGEKFMSLLSEKVRMKILKNKAANEGILDPAKFKKEFLTKEELEEVQAALVTAMQPLFGQFVSELGMGPEDEEEKLELDGPANATKKSDEDKVEDKKSKDTSKKDDKKPDKKMPKKEEDIKEKKKEKVTEKADKPKSKTGKDKAKKPTGKSEKEKKDTVKDKKKPDKTKGKKDTKQKEEL